MQVIHKSSHLPLPDQPHFVLKYLGDIFRAQFGEVRVRASEMFVDVFSEKVEPAVKMLPGYGQFDMLGKRRASVAWNSQYEGIPEGVHHGQVA